MIPQELLRHPDYASLTEERDLPAVNTSFSQPMEGFDAIPIDFCDPANQPYVLRFYLRGFLSRYKAEQDIFKVKEDWPNQTVVLFRSASSRKPFRLHLELRRDDPTHIFLTLGGPQPADYYYDDYYRGSFEQPIFHYGVPTETDKNKAFQEQHLDYETLNAIIKLLTLEPLFPERNDALHLRLDLGPIYDLINLPIPTNERLKHIKEMKAKTVALEDYQVQRSPHYELVCDEGLFFTQGLKFCKEAIRLAIDLLIENGNRLLTEYKDSTDCTAVKDGLVKDLFELTQQVGEQLTELDPKGLLWLAICSKQDSSLNENRVQSEQVVLLRNALVELERCWKELELHPAFERKERISDTALREVGHRWDSDKLCLKRIVEEDHSATSCFCYRGDVTAASEKVHELCIKYKLIAKDTSIGQIKALFSGKETDITIQWLGGKGLLAYLFRQLNSCKFISTYPDTLDCWQVISARFLDKKGECMKDLRNFKNPTGKDNIVEDIVKVFNLNAKQ